MNYLFYLGIIVPTVITICLFLVFIYCWFLQKARKEVLTRRYDPHGKMRRLGLSMDPPPPPEFCRQELATATTPLAARLGEDNMAYTVSRSPSTDQQQQQHQQQHGGNPRRSQLYHTYHDSGISAGGFAAMAASSSASPLAENAISEDDGLELQAAGGGIMYRTCPDSGISGLSMSMAGDPHMTAGPQCPSLNHHHQYHQPAWQEDYSYQQHQQRPSYYHHQQQPHHYPHHQIQQQRPQHLHHTLVQASVHPSHGVCYGDNTNHPQSPQHYTPPPQQHHRRLQQYRMSGHDQQIHLASPSSNQCQPPSAATPACCSGRCSENDQAFELVTSPSSTTASTRPKDLFYQQGVQDTFVTTETSFGPQGAMDVMVTPCGDPRIVNTALPAEQTILSCLLQEQQQQHQQQILDHPTASPQHHRHQEQKLQQPHQNLPNPTASSTPSSSNSAHIRKSGRHRDSGITEDSSSGGSTDQSAGCGSTSSSNNSTTSASRDRPDSQASHSPSTTDSEDSGFRGSREGPAGGAQTTPIPKSNTAVGGRLNKQTNPLLKPMRRPRTKNTRKNNAGAANTSPHGHEIKVANTDSSAPGSPTPLLTLDPQNLTPPPLSEIADIGRGLEMSELSGRVSGPARHNRTPGSAPEPQQWTDEPKVSRKENRTIRDGAAPAAKIKAAVGGGSPGDISTHLSWSYLQGLSTDGQMVAPSSHVTGDNEPDVQVDGSRQFRTDLHHMDVMGYSVV